MKPSVYARLNMLVLGLVGTGTVTAAEPSATRGTVLLAQPEIVAAQARKGEFQPLLRRCAAELRYTPQPIAVLNSKRRYGADGPQHIGDGKVLAADAETSYRAGLCYVLTRDVRYASNAQRVIDAWASTLTGVANHQSQGNVNFKLPYMILAASWVRGVNGWNSDKFDRFLVNTVLPQSESNNPNNHGMWGVFLEASGAAYLGDRGRLEKARSRWGEILRGAAAPDGTLTREIARSDTSDFRGGATKGVRGLAYTHYFMLPSSMSAKIFSDAGRPVWDTAEGKLFGAAFNKAASFTLRPETFPYYTANGGKLQDANNVSYFPLLLSHYRNADAEAVLKQGTRDADPFQLAALFGGNAAKRR